MKQISYICNRCHLPIKNDIYRLYAGIVDKETDELTDETFYLEQTGEVELCGICLAQIDEKIKRMITSYSDVSPAPKRNGFDIEKAVSMRNEGCSYESISKELGCCPQTVANQLSKHGYQEQKGGA